MTHTETVRVFTEVVDAVMIQNDAYPQRRPIERLQAYALTVSRMRFVSLYRNPKQRHRLCMPLTLIC